MCIQRMLCEYNSVRRKIACFMCMVLTAKKCLKWMDFCKDLFWCARITTIQVRHVCTHCYPLETDLPPNHSTLFSTTMQRCFILVDIIQHFFYVGCVWQTSTPSYLTPTCLDGRGVHSLKKTSYCYFFVCLQMTVLFIVTRFVDRIWQSIFFHF